MNAVSRMLKAIHASEDKGASLEKAKAVVQKLKEKNLEVLLERSMKEIRRRPRIVGAFPDGNLSIMLVGARLRHIAGTKWGCI